MYKWVIPIFAVVLVSVVGLWCIITAVSGLFADNITEAWGITSIKRGDRANIAAEYFTGCVYEEKNPIGHEYYYAFKSGENDAYLVRMNKEFNEGMPEEGFKRSDALCLSITGEVKSLKETDGIRDLKTKFAADGITLYTDDYLDEIYQVNYIVRFLAGVGLLIFTGAFIMMLPKFREKRTNVAVRRVYTVFSWTVGGAACIALVYLLFMG